MKPILLLLTLVPLFSGCMRYPATYPTYDRLVNLPTEPHEREVAVLFPGEASPDEPFVTLGVVEVHGGGFTPYNQMIRQLQTKAQTLGVDAVPTIRQTVYRRNLRIGRSHLYRHP